MNTERDPSLAAWAAASEENTALAAWLDANAGRFDFARSVRDGVIRHGDMTPKQRAAALRMMQGDAKRGAAQANAKPIATAATIRDALMRASESGLQRPKLRCGPVSFEWPRAGSKNPGHVYVILAEAGAYLGKITPDGVLMPSWDATPDHLAVVDKVAQDPLAAAVEHGRLTGACACCGRPLSDAESVARGIGPVCAKRFFGA